MSILKSSIVGSCELCGRTGFTINNTPCACLIKFRAFNKMTNGGFNLKTLELVTNSKYEIPLIDSGEQFVEYYAANFSAVEKNGLSLYIYSKGRGRGKTTLAHYLVYKAATFFSYKENYVSKRDFCFIHIEDLAKLENKSSEIWKSTWLVIDDIGNENKSADWKIKSVTSFLQKVMHYRRDHNLPTIITSNYEPGNLSNLYFGDLDSLLEIRPDGSLGGLMFREVEVGGGEDFRHIDDLSAWPV